MVHADGGASSLLDIGQDELLYIYSLVGRQQQTVFPLLCRSIASILLASGESRLASCQDWVSSPYNLFY